MTVLTTLTMPTRLDEGGSLQPVPWRRMVWVTWRQHRVALAGVVVLLGLFAVYVEAVGLQLHHAYAASIACRPASSIACSDLVNTFNDANHVLLGGYVLQVLPALIGAFVGAPVLAHEIETGTFRYAWTQGIGRWRWTIAKLIVLTVVVTATAGLFSVLLSWYYQPYLATGNQALSLTEASPFGGGLFDLRGIAFAAWTLMAFAIGALAGMLIRRVVPAIVATLSAYTGLALVAANVLRQHYLTPLVTSNPNVPGSAWVISQWWTRGGRVVFTGQPPSNVAMQFCPPSTVGPGKGPSPEQLAQCLSRHGYTQLTSYQPAGRFWTFQWIEGGWLLVLSILLLAVTAWLVRRRAT